MNNIILLVIGIIVATFLFFYKNKKLICLMYHNVLIEGKTGIISKKEFEDHMEYIKNMKSYKMEELEKLNYKLPKNSILITFDDGYKNNYTNAFPILKKYGIKATIFLNTRYVGKDPYYLNWSEIKEMYESGLIDFQMHTHSHFPTIRKIEIKGFFENDEIDFVKREYYSIFDKNEKYNNFKNLDFTNLPVFKIRSQISIPGYRLKENFLEEYKKIIKKESFIELSSKKKKEIINNYLKKNKNKYFEKITKKEFLEIVRAEILINKNLIEEKINKKVEYLAYPWGHKFKGNQQYIRKLGVKGFLFTSDKKNNLKINLNKITRINGDKIKEKEKFVKRLKNI